VCAQHESEAFAAVCEVTAAQGNRCKCMLICVYMCMYESMYVKNTQMGVCACECIYMGAVLLAPICMYVCMYLWWCVCL